LLINFLKTILLPGAEGGLYSRLLHAAGKFRDRIDSILPAHEAILKEESWKWRKHFAANGMAARIGAVHRKANAAIYFSLKSKNANAT